MTYRLPDDRIRFGIRFYGSLNVWTVNIKRLINPTALDHLWFKQERTGTSLKHARVFEPLGNTQNWQEKSSGKVDVKGTIIIIENVMLYHIALMLEA